MNRKIRHCVISIIVFIASARAHVTLTFPEARFPPLDFLDTFRTAAPCGVPKSSKSAITNLRVGSSYNVTWRMQYPHQGGFRLQLLSASGAIVQQLAPLESAEIESFDGLDDQTAESHTILFLRECHNCTLRLERQALEWGKSYKFRSCAEVNVLPELPDECSERGESPVGGSCSCHRKFSGKHCQYSNDCSDDSDCLNNGKCVANGVAPNRKSCFCAYGFFGNDCSQQSSRKLDESESTGSVDGESCFAYEGPTDSNLLKYGIFNVNCFKTFALNNADGDFIFSRVIKGEIEIILDFATDSWLGLGWRPLQIPNRCRLFPDLATHASVSTIDVDSLRNDSDNIAIGGFTHSAFDTVLHPMDCVDVVMASIFVDENNGKSYLHIRDMYTRDRSTPLSDSYYDGDQSLTAAYGHQISISENMTRSIVMFRRMIREIEPTDHPLGPGEVFVIFAKGQTGGAYNHLAKSAIERGKSLNAKNFYRADQWKYHGGKNRGVRNLEFVSETETSNSDSPLRHLKEAQHTLSTTTNRQTTKTTMDDPITMATTTESPKHIDTTLTTIDEFINDLNLQKVRITGIKLDEENSISMTTMSVDSHPETTRTVSSTTTSSDDISFNSVLSSINTLTHENSSVMNARLSFAVLTSQLAIFLFLYM